MILPTTSSDYAINYLQSQKYTMLYLPTVSSIALLAKPPI